MIDRQARTSEAAPTTDVAGVAEADPAALAAALFSLHRSEDGRVSRTRIGVLGFSPADSATFHPVRWFLGEDASRFGKLPDLEGVGR